MNAFAHVPSEVRHDQTTRHTLLAQPPEFFRAALGDNPDPSRCLHLVETLFRTMAGANLYVNDTYHVRVRNIAPFSHLAIGRHDNQPCVNWRDFQQIKNEIVGPEYEAVELFPAESRKMDTANVYHLYVVADENFRFPFGFGTRVIIEDGQGRS